MSVPLQNRVAPDGGLHARPERGAWMGNRGGRFHRPDRTLGGRRWMSKAWITCLLSFKGRQRSVWANSYTELFFLDEATALAAGHRPCFECRRADARAFATAWADPAPRAGAMDDVLHRVRREGPWEAAAETLPDGTMIRMERGFALVLGDAILPWSFAGYGSPERRPAGSVAVVTPRPVVDCLTRGYVPEIHATAAT
ncbi:MAG: hypothetical protein AAGK98_13990 [Pseudomonadota bacterium]